MTADLEGNRMGVIRRLGGCGNVCLTSRSVERDGEETRERAFDLKVVAAQVSA